MSEKSLFEKDYKEYQPIFHVFGKHCECQQIHFQYPQRNLVSLSLTPTQ